MKNRLLLIVLTGLLSVNAQAQWMLDSANTAGTYPYAAVNGNKAVFSNGGEWNVFDAVTGVHTYGNFAISRAMIEVVSAGDKVMFAGGKYGYFADPQYTKSVNVYNATTNTWSTWNMGTAREVGGAAAIGGKAVFAGGTGRSDIAGPVYMYNKVDIFDVATGARTSGKLSKGRSNIAAGAAGNKIVFAGGWYWDMMYSVLPANTVDIYDVVTGVWTKTTLSKKRENIAVAVIGDKILFAGGTGSMGAVTNVDMYNSTTNTWSVSYMPAAGDGMKSAVIGSDAYFGGGITGPGNMLYKYNSVAGTWSSITIPTSLTGFSMSVINGRLIIAGGTIPGTSTYSDLVQIYDPVANSWYNEHLSIARTNVSALTIGSKGYFAGGISVYGYPTPTYTKRVDIFNAPFRMEQSIASEISNWDVQVYPNPAVNTVHIAIQDAFDQALTASITDINGNLIQQFQLDATVQNIDVSELPSGIYFIIVQDNSARSIVKKLVKQ